MLDNLSGPFKAAPRQVLTPEQEILKAIGEVDLALFREDYLENCCQGLLNRLKLWLYPYYKHQVTTRLQQFDFLSEIKQKMQPLSIEQQALIFLGAFQFIQGRFLEFDSTGPLFRMVLKKTDLERVIGEYIDEFNIEQLLNRPRLINDQADKIFAEFIAINQDIIVK